MSIKKPLIPKCTYCGHELTPISLNENIWICNYCKFYYRAFSGNPFPKLGLIEKPVITKTVSSGPFIPEKRSVDETEIFINKVATSLTHSPDRQEYYRRGLKDVFEGRLSMDEWFTRTKVETGMKEIELLKLLHKCMRGIRDKEISKIRRHYAERIKMLSTLYGE
jgi:hypothetical protein